jgi:uncharacterized protein YggE
MRRFILFPFLTVSLIAAEPGVSPHFVRASGDATVTANPDRASVDIGVQTHAPTAQAAAQQNAEQTGQVVKTIRHALGSGGEVKTSDYRLAPQYEYTANHPARLTGYEATNTVRVTVDDLSILGKIIDAATSTGANNISGISFTLKDDGPLRATALRQAAINARANAETVAKALDLQVVGVLQVEPTEIPAVRPLPMYRQAVAMSAAPATPIEAGTLDVHASVTVTLETK